MENKNLRNVLMAAGLAVFAGVLTLGVNAAFGLDVPIQDPAGAALHSPVFNGIDVKGKIENTGANNDGAVAILDNVGIQDNLLVGKVVEIIKHLRVHEDIDVNGVINNSSNTNDGAVVISDFDGIKISAGNLDNGGSIMNSLGNPVSIIGNLTVTSSNIIGKITKAPLGNGKITSTFLDTQSVSNSQMTLGGAGIPVNVEDDLSVSGIVDILGSIKNNKIVKEGISDVPQAVKIDDALEVVNNAVINGNLFATQNATVAGNLTVSGNATVTKDLTVSGNANISEDLNASKSIVIGSPGVDGKLSLKGGGGKIMTKGTTNAGVNFDNPIVQTGWMGGGLAFGDYTALNSGYAWTGSEPISVVAGQNGVFFSKGNNGTAYQTQLGKIDTSGNLSITGGITATKIGRYHKVSNAGSFAPYVKLPANSGNMSSNAVLCPAGNIAVNCGFSLYSDNIGTPYNGSGIYLEGMVNGAAGTAGCNYAIVNSTATDKYAKLTIMCFDPTTNN